MNHEEVQRIVNTYESQALVGIPIEQLVNGRIWSFRRIGSPLTDSIIYVGLATNKITVQTICTVMNMAKPLSTPTPCPWFEKAGDVFDGQNAFLRLSVHEDVLQLAPYIAQAMNAAEASFAVGVPRPVFRAESNPRETTKPQLMVLTRSPWRVEKKWFES